MHGVLFPKILLRFHADCAAQIGSLIDDPAFHNSSHAANIPHMDRGIAIHASALDGVEELPLVFFLRQRTGIVFAEDSVTVAGDQIVSPIAKPSRQQPQRKRKTLPDAAQFMQDEDYSVGPGRELLVRLVVVQDHIDGVQVARIGAESFENAACELALQRGKAETIVRIALQNKLNEPVAQAANAVVKNDRIGGIIGHTDRAVPSRQ